MNVSGFRPWVGFTIVFVALAGWIGWLRAPNVGVTMWNVDETIHAAAARTLLEGGVMYRDAVDQRTPLTYYAVAAIFRVAGINNLFAVRIAITGLIVATAFLLFLTGVRTRSTATGLWSAFIFAALANQLLFPGDTNAAHTEWFVAFFTTAAALVFLSSAGIPNFRRSTAVGALFGLAFLSKQPALADLGAPIGTLMYLGAMRAARWREIARSTAGIFAGFGAVVVPVIAAFVLAGAGRDFLFYTWTYNIRFYGSEVGWDTRLLSVEPFFSALAHLYPLVSIALVVGALTVVVRVAQLRFGGEQNDPRRWESYLLLWCATSLVGAMASGRGFYHYFFQCLPPFAWLAAWLPGLVTGNARVTRSAWRVAVVAVFALALAVSIFSTPLAARKVSRPPLDPALRIAAYIREHTEAADKIFAWGYNPDIYMYADRSPASRFLYCTFQTGLIPWTNEAPGIDTSYAIVPGSMETLLADLRRNRPVFIVDCGVGPHRRFSKYPLEKFAPLYAYVSANYVEIDPATFMSQGFRLFMVRDSAKRRSAAENDLNLHPLPLLSGVAEGYRFTVSAGENSKTTLRRLALDMDGVEFAAVRFPPASSMKFQIEIPPSQTMASHRLEAVADWADGTRTVSAPLVTAIVSLRVTEEQRTLFALPRIFGAVPAAGVRALLPPYVSSLDGERRFQLHAPSLLRYRLPENVTGVRGRFGIQPGAYAANNKAPTDGAEFIIRTVAANGKARVRLYKWLRPAVVAADRPEQIFRIPLDELSAGDSLEFEITPGPDGNPASDWAFWSDLMLEVSP